MTLFSSTNSISSQGYLGQTDFGVSLVQESSAVLKEAFWTATSFSPLAPVAYGLRALWSYANNHSKEALHHLEEFLDLTSLGPLWTFTNGAYALCTGRTVLGKNEESKISAVSKVIFGAVGTLAMAYGLNAVLARRPKFEILPPHGFDDVPLHPLNLLGGILDKRVTKKELKEAFAIQQRGFRTQLELELEKINSASSRLILSALYFDSKNNHIGVQRIHFPLEASLHPYSLGTVQSDINLLDPTRIPRPRGMGVDLLTRRMRFLFGCPNVKKYWFHAGDMGIHAWRNCVLPIHAYDLDLFKTRFKSFLTGVGLKESDFPPGSLDLVVTFRDLAHLLHRPDLFDSHPRLREVAKKYYAENPRFGFNEEQIKNNFYLGRLYLMWEEQVHDFPFRPRFGWDQAFKEVNPNFNNFFQTFS